MTYWNYNVLISSSKAYPTENIVASNSCEINRVWKVLILSHVVWLRIVEKEYTLYCPYWNNSISNNSALSIVLSLFLFMKMVISDLNDKIFNFMCCQKHFFSSSEIQNYQRWFVTYAYDMNKEQCLKTSNERLNERPENFNMLIHNEIFKANHVPN